MKLIPGKLYKVATRSSRFHHPEKKIFSSFVNGIEEDMVLGKAEIAVAMYIGPELPHTNFALILYKDKIIGVHIDNLSKI